MLEHMFGITPWRVGAELKRVKKILDDADESIEETKKTAQFVRVIAHQLNGSAVRIMQLADELARERKNA